MATFSTTDIGTNGVLTNSNQTLTAAGSGQAIAAVDGTFTLGKYRIQLAIDVLSTVEINARIGIALGLPGFNFNSTINQATAYEFLQVPSQTPYHVKQHLTSHSVWGDNVAAGDVIDVYYDLDNGFMYLAKNGVMVNSGDPGSSASGTGAIWSFPTGESQYYFICMVNFISSSSQLTLNSPSGNPYGYTDL